MKKLIEKKYFYIVALLIIIFDQATKLYFQNLLKYAGNSINILGEDFFKFTLVYNKGIAFGIDLGGKWILSAISLIAGIAIAVYIYRLKSEQKLESWAFSFVLGGALGNLIDRFFYREGVIDFLDFDFPDFIMPRWPVFNLADSFVSIGMILLFVVYFMESSKKK